MREERLEIEKKSNEKIEGQRKEQIEKHVFGV